MGCDRVASIQNFQLAIWEPFQIKNPTRLEKTKHTIFLLAEWRVSKNIISQLPLYSVSNTGINPNYVGF